MYRCDVAICDVAMFHIATSPQHRYINTTSPHHHIATSHLYIITSSNRHMRFMRFIRLRLPAV
jgi:hypothetical protein